MKVTECKTLTERQMKKFINVFSSRKLELQGKYGTYSNYFYHANVFTTFN